MYVCGILHLWFTRRNANPTFRSVRLPNLRGFDPINDDAATKARRRKVALLQFVVADCNAALTLRRGDYGKAKVRRKAAAALVKVERCVCLYACL